MYLTACLHGVGGPQIGEVTCRRWLHLSCKRDQIKMRDCMDRRVTPPKRATSATWGPPPPCKQALTIPYLVVKSLKSTAALTRVNTVIIKIWIEFYVTDLSVWHRNIICTNWMWFSKKENNIHRPVAGPEALT